MKLDGIQSTSPLIQTHKTKDEVWATFWAVIRSDRNWTRTWQCENTLSGSGHPIDYRMLRLQVDHSIIIGAIMWILRVDVTSGDITAANMPPPPWAKLQAVAFFGWALLQLTRYDQAMLDRNAKCASLSKFVSLVGFQNPRHVLELSRNLGCVSTAYKAKCLSKTFAWDASQYV